MVDRSALAKVNDHLWDMNRPLEEDSVVKLLSFFDEDPFHVNRAFWRSCSFMLGAAIESVFREDIFVELHSFPAPNGKTAFIFEKFTTREIGAKPDFLGPISPEAQG